MPENFAIIGEKQPYPDAKTKVYVLGKKQPKYGVSNGEIDLYPVDEVKRGVAIALTNTQTEQVSNLKDLKKLSSPLGYLAERHTVKKNTLRIISEEELGRILESHNGTEDTPSSNRGSGNYYRSYSDENW